MLLNRDRANAIMDKHKIDGLLAAQKINVYYLTDFPSNTLLVERHFTSFAVLPRRADAPAGMCIGFGENGRLANMGTWVPNIIAISGRVSPTAANVGPRNRELDVDGDPVERFVFQPGASLTPIEERWAVAARARVGRFVATPAEGLKRLIVDAGLEKSRIGTDDPRLIEWLNAMGLDRLTGVDASNIFREIRMVKSEDEISLLRQAATINEAAVEATIATIREGATNEELERVYMADIARQGGRGVYILFGMVAGLRHGHVIRDEPFMVDALGTYAWYNGDLGRTVIVGEPNAEIEKRNDAMQKGWKAACEMMRPGVKGSEIVKRVVELVQREGFSSFNHCVAHTVGLEHTDHPLPMGIDGMGGRADFVVEENMVLNFDMPHIEWGWGSMHLEDTLLITKDGFEPLTSLKTNLRTVT
jgi:Xaa-Pro aminopeptidase